MYEERCYKRKIVKPIRIHMQPKCLRIHANVFLINTCMNYLYQECLINLDFPTQNVALLKVVQSNACSGYTYISGEF